MIANGSIAFYQPIGFSHELSKMTQVRTVWGGYIATMSFLLFWQSVIINGKLNDIKRMQDILKYKIERLR